MRDYFRTTEVPEHLQKDKEIFLSLYQDADRDVEVPAGLGDKLSLLIDEKAEEEQRFFSPNKSKRNWRWIGSVAATILVIIGIGYGVENLGRGVCPPTPQDTFSRSGRSLSGAASYFNGSFYQFEPRHCSGEGDAG